MLNIPRTGLNDNNCEQTMPTLSSPIRHSVVCEGLMLFRTFLVPERLHLVFKK